METVITIPSSVKIFISTGEVSGDLQGSLLVKALHREAIARGLELEIVALGGPKIAAAGVSLFGDTTAIGSVGIIESLPYLLPTLQIQRKVKKYLREQPPDVVVLIDYMGPNLGIGSYVRKHLPEVPIIWYIAPQEWVWSLGSGNTTNIVRLADRLLAIFPEEARYFQEKGANVTWVGNPIVDRMQKVPSREEARRVLGIDDDTIAIALLPASRQQEIKYLMPVMFEAAKIIQEKLPQVHFWIPLSREIYRSSILSAINEYQLRATIYPFSSSSDREIEEDRTLLILAGADLAIAKSGTVNLEIALLEVPQVVIYRVNPITAAIARHLLKFSIPFMSPANLVQMKPVVPELLQDRATPENIVFEALELILNPERREKTIADYREMARALGEKGACDRAAKAILDVIAID